MNLVSIRQMHFVHFHPVTLIHTQINSESYLEIARAEIRLVGLSVDKLYQYVFSLFTENGPAEMNHQW